MSSPEVSLVVPARDEAGNIGPLVAEIRTALAAAGIVWEAFLIDDGSADGTWAEISLAAEADPRVHALRNDGPLGKSAALARGFRACRAPFVVMLDGDGQDDPAEIPRMLARLRADPGVGLVNGWKHPRLDPWHKTLPSAVFNLLISAVSGLSLHDHNCGLKALRAEVARELPLGRDMHRFIPVLVWRAGHRVVEVAVRHRPRTRGRSKYGVSRFFSGLAGIARVAFLLPAGTPPRPRRREPRGRLRRSVYAVLTAVALGAVLGRIGAVASVDRLALESRLVNDAVAKAGAEGGPADAESIRRRIRTEKGLVRPFLSANDRSRWLTIRSLVERGEFAIDELVVEPGWDTIDAVAHPDASGRLRLYSSKPPLLAVLCAGPYWALSRLTGWTLGDHPFELGRMLMVLFGLVPLGITILFTCRLVEALGTSDWARIWAAALIACGTLLSTFAVVLTNHLPAAACAAASAWLLLRIRRDGLRSSGGFVGLGLTAGLAAAFELPALAWLATALVVAARADWRRTLLQAIPAATLVAAAALGTNWLAHGTVVPPYAQRDAQRPAAAATTEESWNPGNWYDYAIRLPNGRLLQSYWRTPRGVDRGEPAAARYALHALVGHHGVFSLTPAWLLVVPGLWILGRRGRPGDGLAEIATAIALVSVVVIGFYLARPQVDRNYGGVTSGFRWAFWLAPLWVAACVPAADRLAGSRAGRGLALILLALSLVSVANPTWTPWTPPWIERWLVHAGWISAP